MNKYHYEARDIKNNQIVKSTIQAQSELEAARLIRASGLTPINIKSSDTSDLFSGLRRVKTKDKVLFSRQLSTMINAGLPLIQALNNVSDQTISKNFKTVIDQVIKDVEGGKSFSAALEKHPQVFNNVFVSMVASGETSGTLDKSLSRLAIQQEKDASIVSKIRGAMIYPALIILVMVVVVVFMIVKVVPQIQILYTSFPGQSLPIETRVMISLANFFKHFWWLLIIILVLAVFFLNRWFKTSSGKKFFDFIKLKTPPFSKLLKKLYMARFSRTAATLIGAGVPLLQVLQITSEAVNNYYIAESITKAADKVKGGKSLADRLKGDPNFLPLVPSVIKIGEQSGTMEEMLSKAADYYEKEVDDAVSNISSLVEPVMMILLGIVAIIIVLAVLLPIYGLAGSGAISGQGG